MTIFEGAVLDQVIAEAQAHHIEPEALLAVVEVESAGKSLEVDGKTPCLLFERHVFYRELKKAGKTIALGNAEAMGLAIPAWSPSTQYKDQGTSAKRLALFSRAKTIDEECADRSCSWGVGQTCGFLAEELHFKNAVTMMAFMTAGGVPAQVDCMIREIDNKKLGPKLNDHDWAGFARIYNGPGYAKNNYDAKMEIAHRKWVSANLSQAPRQPKPIVVPPDVKPLPPIVQPGHVTDKQAGVGAGIVAFFAAIWAALMSFDTATVIFMAMLLVLLIATAIIMWRRHKVAQITPLGVLATVGSGE